MSNECFTLQMLIALAELLWDQLKTQRRTSGNSSKVQQPFNSRSMDDLLAFLDGTHVEGDGCFVCVVIHNIDGPGLRDSETQQYLARMASCSHICVVASIDHVNAPLCKYLFVIVLYLIEKDPIWAYLESSCLISSFVHFALKLGKTCHPFDVIVENYPVPPFPK